MNAEEILHAAAEKAPAERAAYLDTACGPNAGLRALVEGLLQALDQAGSFLEQPLFDPYRTSPGPPDPPDDAESPGGRAGPYKLLQLIGEGGMGTVWFAQQTEPI